MFGNILIGEDNLVSQQVMEALLETKCKKVTSVAGYAELMNELDKEQYDVLLLDYHLDEDADFMVTQLRNGKSINKNIPVFILSAEPEVVVLEKMRGNTIQGYIKKPIDFALLEAALNHTLTKESSTLQNHNPDIVDLSKLEVLLGDSPERVRRIVKIFKTETLDYFIRMEQLLAKQDWQNLRALVHRARASYGYLGLTSLHNQLTLWEVDIDGRRNQSSYRQTIDSIKANTIEVLKKLEEIYPADI